MIQLIFRKFFICLGSVIILSSCASTMTVNEAKQIASKQFYKIDQVPPKGLGEIIQRYVDEYIHGNHGHWFFNYTSKEPTKNVINNLASGSRKNGYWQLQERGRQEYYRGNIEVAFLFADAAAKVAPRSQLKAECLYDKAWFQAEAGDFISANSSLQKARTFISMDSLGTAGIKKMDSKDLLKQRYLSANAGAAVFFCNGKLGESKGKIS